MFSLLPVLAAHFFWTLVLLNSKQFYKATTTYKVCGLDVHKEMIYACTKKGKYTSEVKQFPTDSEGLSELHHWLHGERV